MRGHLPTKTLSAVVLALAAGSASAVPYALDTLLFSVKLPNSGDATETAALNTWLASAAGQAAGYSNVAATLELKVDDASVYAYSNGDGQWYIDIGTTAADFFVLKFGTGGTGVDTTTYYFANVGELSKLVWSDEQVNYLTGGDCGAKKQSACNIGRLSHYALFLDPPSSGIPEPGSLALFGTALAGLGAWRRR